MNPIFTPSNRKLVLSKLLKSRNPHFTIPFSIGNGKVCEIPLLKIIYIESDSALSVVQMNQNTRPKISIAQTIGECEAQLFSYGFIRIHRKYLINLSYLSSFSDSTYIELVENIKLPIARRRLKRLIEELDFYNIPVSSKRIA